MSLWLQHTSEGTKHFHRGCAQVPFRESYLTYIQISSSSRESLCLKSDPVEQVLCYSARQTMKVHALQWLSTSHKHREDGIKQSRNPYAQSCYLACPSLQATLITKNSFKRSLPTALHSHSLVQTHKSLPAQTVSNIVLVPTALGKTLVCN